LKLRLPLLLGLLLTACGYRFAAPGGALPEGIRSVAAPVFDNHTAEPAAEVLFTQAFREQLGRAGVLGGDAAEANVQGSLDAVSDAAILASISLDGVARLPTYRINAVAKLKLLKEGRVVALAVVTGSEDYLSGADLLLTEANRQAALRRLAETMMREGYERLASR
jgi:outer membrane lipopolysaccharide assembly protein LptE/RlpB